MEIGHELLAAGHVKPLVYFSSILAVQLRCMVAMAVVVLNLAGQAWGIDYYFSPSGDDSNSGTSSSSPWKTLSLINNINLSAGDRILLEGGARFEGPIQFDVEDLGTETDPIILTSYGIGRAVVDGGNGPGLFAHNTGGIFVSRVDFIGSGRAENSADGIAFYNDLTGDVKLAGVYISEVEVRAFGKDGIKIGGWNRESGFRNIRITRSVTRDNGLNGVITFAQEPHAHSDVYIGFVYSHHNSGSPRAWPGSGSGIVLGGVRGGLIEWSVAHSNGWLGNAGIGIWAYASTRVVIRHNEAFNNRTAGKADGSGFALDGGVTDSLIEHNFSHDNDGAGYALNQYAGALPWSRNTVRYNVSINDGRRNGYGGIQIWSGGSTLSDAEVTNNLVVMGPAGERTPSALAFRGGTLRFSIRQNTFLTLGGARFMTVVPGQENLRFAGNVCWCVANWTISEHVLTVSGARTPVTVEHGMGPCFLGAQSFIG
jgi:hypothetical protein